MKIDRIYNQRAQDDCLYQLRIEVGASALEQCVADGYDGYNLRWHLAWVLADQAAECCIIARHVAHYINDICDAGG